MSSFSKKIQLPYTKSKGYDFIERNYEIIRSICKKNFTITKINLSLLYDDGDISCSVDSIEDFKINSYGSSEVDITMMSIAVYTEEVGDIYFSVDNERFIICSGSKMYLSKIVELFDKYEMRSKHKTQFIECVTHSYYNVQAKIIENSNIGGSGNTIAAVNSDTHEEKKQCSRKPVPSKFWRGLLQGVVANYVWWILGLLSVGVISMYRDNIIAFLGVHK